MAFYEFQKKKRQSFIINGGITSNHLGGINLGKVKIKWDLTGGRWPNKVKFLQWMIRRKKVHIRSKPWNMVRLNKKENCYLVATRRGQESWNVLSHNRHWVSLVFFYPEKNNWSFNGLPWWLSGKVSACQCRRQGFGPWSGRSHMPRSN